MTPEFKQQIMNLVVGLTLEQTEKKVGQTWYVLYPNSSCVSTVKILEISKATVLLRDQSAFVYNDWRKLISSIQWIELVEEK